MKLRFNIERWNAWAPGLDTVAAWEGWAESQGPLPAAVQGGSTPDVSYMPAMLRRRLTPLARAALHVAWQCLDEGQQVPLIVSSLYGESDRTFELTDAVAKEELMSPASFSLSVHNAIAGQLSIARKVTTEITCLSPVGSGVVPALLEAQGMLAEGGCDQVLIVFYDQPLPELYRASVPGPVGVLACALLVSRDNSSGAPFTLRLEGGAAVSGSVQEQEEQLQGLIRVLAGGADAAHWHSSGGCWTWFGHDAQD